MKLSISTESLSRKECLDTIQKLIQKGLVIHDGNLSKTLAVEGTTEQLKEAMEIFNGLMPATL